MYEGTELYHRPQLAMSLQDQVRGGREARKSEPSVVHTKRLREIDDYGQFCRLQ